jgi:anaerobic selenocysteine-containing dehydrogenase
MKRRDFLKLFLPAAAGAVGAQFPGPAQAVARPSALSEAVAEAVRLSQQFLDSMQRCAINARRAADAIREKHIEIENQECIGSDEPCAGEA